MANDQVTVSIDLKTAPLALLIERNQTLGRKVDEIREERAYLNALIAKRIAAGEAEHAPADGDAVAPGAVIEAKASA